MSNTVESWKSSTVLKMLKRAGLRPTRQRVQIAELLFSRGDRHLTAEILYAEAAGNRYPPSLATIYNALRDFATHGLLREIALYGSTVWYDTKTGSHFHYYVDSRKHLMDVPDNVVLSLDIPAPPGMRVVGVDIVARVEPIG